MADERNSAALSNTPPILAPGSVGRSPQLSLLSPDPSQESADHLDDWRTIGEQQHFLRPSSNFTSQELRNRGADDVVVYDYPLNPDYLGRAAEGTPVGEGGPSLGGFSEANDTFFRVSKKSLIDSREFNQIINLTKEPRPTPSRVPQLGIIDFPQCYDTYDLGLLNSMGEKLALQRAGETGFGSAYLQGVQALPGRGRFRTGISLWASPKKLPNLGSRNDTLILFASFPYFGESRGEITFNSESESVALLDFNHLGARVRGRKTVASGKEKDDFEKILVHQARYIIFDNYKMATFRSKEDSVRDQVPLHGFQERMGAFRAMTHMIANSMNSGLWVLGKLQASVYELERDIDQIMSDGEAYESNQEMRITPADDPQQEGSMPGVVPSARVQQEGREGQQGWLEDYEGAQRNDFQKRKQRNVRDLLASLSGHSAGLFAVTSVAERQVAVLQDLHSVFSTSSRELSYLRNAALIPISSEYREHLSRILEIIDELLRERESFIKKLKNLVEYMEIRRYIFFGFLRYEVDKRKEETLAQQTRTLSSFAIVTTAFLPLGFCATYFGMNNIKEFNAHPISRKDFWLITGPVSAAIILLTAVMVLWKHPRAANFKSYVKEKLRRSPKGKINDLEDRISPMPNPLELSTLQVERSRVEPQEFFSQHSPSRVMTVLSI